MKTTFVIKSIIILIAVLFLVSCHPLFCSWDFGYEQLKKEPPKEKVIGKYQLTKESQDFLDENYNVWPLEIELLENNRFVFLYNQNPVSLADKLFTSHEGLNETVKQKTGKWYISKSESYDCLIELEGICVTPFTEKDNRFAIPITIGDGDECNGIIYEKMD